MRKEVQDLQAQEAKVKLDRLLDAQPLIEQLFKLLTTGIFYVITHWGEVKATIKAIRDIFRK